MQPRNKKRVPGETNETECKGFFSPSPFLCLPVSQDFHWQWGEREGWCVPREGSSACESGQRPFHSLIFALRVEKETRRRGKSKGKKETKRGGPSLNASRQNSLNARESSCRCRFSPFSPPLPSPPLPSSFPVFLPSRCLSSSLPPCQPAGPVTLPPHFRASRIHTSAAVAPCPRLSPIIPRQRKTKRRRNKYSPGRKRGRRGGKGSTLQLSMTYYFFRSPTTTLSPFPFFFLDL